MSYFFPFLTKSVYNSIILYYSLFLWVFFCSDDKVFQTSSKPAITFLTSSSNSKLKSWVSDSSISFKAFLKFYALAELFIYMLFDASSLTMLSFKRIEVIGFYEASVLLAAEVTKLYIQYSN